MDLAMLAQTPAVDVGDFEKWWHFGPLGILGLIAASAAVALLGFVLYWLYQVTVPHYRAKQADEREDLKAKREAERLHLKEKQRLELERESKLTSVMDTLTTCQVEQLALTKQVMAGQEKHANTCDNTHRLVERLVEAQLEHG